MAWSNHTPPERAALIRESYARTGSAAKTSAELKTSKHTVLNVCADLVEQNQQAKKERRGRPAPVPVSAVHEMRAAAAKYDEDDEFSEPIAQVWQREEERCARAIKKAQVASTLRWRCPNKNLILSAISDMHIAPGTPVDFKRMREDAELIRDTPGCFAVLAGDQIDNHIKHRSAILAARSQPEDQYRLFEHYLSILGPKCLVVTSGNHDDWTNNFAGVDVLGRIVRENRIFYAQDEAWLEIEVGSQKYTIAVRHQYRYGSQFNQTHTVKQWLRLGPREFDVGVIGHHHEAAIEQTVYRGKQRWVCRPGSYQITSAYSRQYGFNHSVPTSPTFLFHGDEYGIVGYESVRSMARSTKAIRELGAA